jgi:hypothetical protein
LFSQPISTATSYRKNKKPRKKRGQGAAGLLWRWGQSSHFTARGKDMNLRTTVQPELPFIPQCIVIAIRRYHRAELAFSLSRLFDLDLGMICSF